MTNLLHQLNRYDPYFVGFDQLFRKLSNFEFSRQPNYAPYNIVRGPSGDRFSIQLAVAGFDESEIQITHEPDRNTLTIKAAKADNDDQNFLHKGIATRNFSRSWTVADNVEVRGASLENGLLSIDLEHVLPEEKKPRTIGINQSKGKDSGKEFLSESE